MAHGKRVLATPGEVSNPINRYPLKPSAKDRQITESVSPPYLANYFIFSIVDLLGNECWFSKLMMPQINAMRNLERW
jgi:hypothetical protein